MAIERALAAIQTPGDSHIPTPTVEAPVVPPFLNHFVLYGRFCDLRALARTPEGAHLRTRSELHASREEDYAFSYVRDGEDEIARYERFYHDRETTHPGQRVLEKELTLSGSEEASGIPVRLTQRTYKVVDTPYGKMYATLQADDTHIERDYEIQIGEQTIICGSGQESLLTPDQQQAVVRALGLA